VTTTQLKLDVVNALDALLPAMVVDGGGAQIVSVDSDGVVIEFVGSCQFCPSRRLSAEALDRGLRARVPAMRQLRIVSQNGRGCEEVIKTGAER
jgi:Fe-S cluster biogenesis protein NfuA